MKTLSRLFKDPISGLMHLASAVVALAGLLVLWSFSPAEGNTRPGLVVYGATLVLLFLASSAYHLIKTSPARELWLRRLDHTAIFLLIAGTYTPVCLTVLTGAWRWGMLITIWILAAIGIAFKLLFIKAPRWASVGIYIAMGWLGTIGVMQLLQALPLAAVGWLLLGGLLYTGGAVIYGLKRPNLIPGVFGFHEIWHMFVTAASAAHFVFMLGYVLPFPAR
jgi:hemolysin III